MNTPRTFFLALLATGIACAQDTAAPAPAESAQTEMQKWIATTDEQWQAVLKRDVTGVQATELEKLKQQYVAALEAAVTKASAAGDLDGVVALRNEEKRFAGTNLFPEQDEVTDAATVKQIRAAVRAQIAKVEKDTAARTKALHAKYDQVLAQAQTQLTQRQRIEDALLVKAKREEVAKAWLAGVPAPVAPVAVADQNKPRTATPLPPTTASRNVPPIISTPSQPIIVAAELRAKGTATEPGPNTIVFDAPKGDGRRAPKGILLKNDAGVGKSGSTWIFRWTREKSAQCVQIIHPIGRGQAIVHIDSRWVALTAPATWQEVGWRGGNKKAIKETNGFA